MKVIILTEAGKSIGFGHYTRCSALFHAFKEQNITPLFAVSGTEDILMSVNGCQVLSWVEYKELLASRILEADIVIVDSYLADYDTYLLVSNAAVISVFLDDVQRVDYPHGIILNGSVGAQLLKYNPEKHPKCFLGNDYVLLRPAFWDTMAELPRKELKQVLITMGGSGECEFIKEVIERLQQTFPDYRIKAIIPTLSEESKLKLNNGAGENTELFFDFIQSAEMLQLLRETDVVISAGGQTLNELARLGIPTVAVSLAKNQMQNINGYLDCGFIEFAGWKNDPFIFEEIIKKITSLKSWMHRKNKFSIGTRIIDGQGARRVVSGLLEYYSFLKN